MQETKELVITHKPCVYFLYSKEGELLYIGRTGALVSRIGMHYTECAIPFERVKYIEYKHIEEAAVYERSYIRMYNPEYNYKPKFSKREWIKRAIS